MSLTQTLMSEALLQAQGVVNESAPGELVGCLVVLDRGDGRHTVKVSPAFNLRDRMRLVLQVYYATLHEFSADPTCDTAELFAWTEDIAAQMGGEAGESLRIGLRNGAAAAERVMIQRERKRGR